jgi:hypothetical protein
MQKDRLDVRMRQAMGIAKPPQSALIFDTIYYKIGGRGKMAAQLCQKCKQAHPGRVCDYDEKGECAETISVNEVTQTGNEPSKDEEDGSRRRKPGQDKQDSAPSRRSSNGSGKETTSTATHESAGGIAMDCLICKDLERALESRRSKYIEARSATYYWVSTDLAAQKNVDMECAKSDLEEHQLGCASSIG